MGELLDLVTDLIRKQETENIAELNGTENVGDLLTNVVNQLHQRLSFQCQVSLTDAIQIPRVKCLYN